jgi:uncharacterized protein DUF1634
MEFATLESGLARLMLLGVIGSAVCLAAGLALWLTGNASTILLRIGLVTLLATPMLRVAVSLVEALKLRDWFFVATTLMVAMLLMVTLLLSFRAAGF